MTELARSEDSGASPTEEPNPYAAPRSRVVGAQRDGPRPDLAGRGTRLLAAILDYGVYLVCVPILFATGAIGRDFFAEDTTLSVLGTWLVLFVVLAIFCVQAYLLVKDGTTLGKRAVGIRIVTVDGERVGVVRVLLVRTLLPAFVNSVCCFFVVGLPCLIDTLFIFGPQRRCLHDLMAGTVVIQR